MREKSYSSGELANLIGVSTDTLRHYERKGVLARPRRAPNGYRQYPPDTLERLWLIRRALAVGFTLDELSRFLQVRDRGGSPCAEVREQAALKLADVEARLNELKQLRNELRSTLEKWDRELAQRCDGKPAYLLERLLPTSSGTPAAIEKRFSSMIQKKGKI